VIGQLPFRSGGLGLAGLERAIEASFSIKHAPAVVLVINSPGGSPVQSALIAARIRQLAEKKERKVIAFVEDVAASGGYWLACAADEIIAHDCSIVGSIGVISSGFGFAEAIDRLGIERRIHTSGPEKSMLDPFRPESERDLARLGEIQTEVHESFKAIVRQRRGDRLKSDEEMLFSGRFWTGRAALEIGLVDGIGQAHDVLRERYGETIRLRTMNAPRPWWQRLRPPGAADRTAEMVAGALGLIEERALWARYGL
jgi:serine protease SohB